MKNAKYTVTMELEKSPQDVFNHLIELSKWWPEDYEGGSLRLNGEFVLKTGDAHYSKNKVIEFLPDKKLGWLTLESIRKTDGFDWSGTKMIFELAPIKAVRCFGLLMTVLFWKMNMTDWFRYVISPLRRCFTTF